ncbi:hypothetical protein [Moorena sp. SIO3H5]|uniref:hypothetical protein n=1 Tax=Moorena sp. SIO3H5 TaxID=2607834 RepID=UPI0013BA45FE|nr:hypothetical protein [Moorena sp. SIO3H5]NEO68957.1 fatty acyl-AMP ligase [Moorena sp. SIO3H5]
MPAYPPPRRSQNLSRLLAIASDPEAPFALTTTSLMTELTSRFAQHPALAQLHLLATNKCDRDQGLNWFEPSLDSSSERLCPVNFRLYRDTQGSNCE